MRLAQTWPPSAPPFRRAVRNAQQGLGLAEQREPDIDPGRDQVGGNQPRRDAVGLSVIGIVEPPIAPAIGAGGSQAPEDGQAAQQAPAQRRIRVVLVEYELPLRVPRQEQRESGRTAGPRSRKSARRPCRRSATPLGAGPPAPGGAEPRARQGTRPAHQPVPRRCTRRRRTGAGATAAAWLRPTSPFTTGSSGRSRAAAAGAVRKVPGCAETTTGPARASAPRVRALRAGTGMFRWLVDDLAAYVVAAWRQFNGR